MKYTVLLLFYSLFLFACKNETMVNEYRAIEFTQLLAAEERVVVLGRRHNTQHETEVDYIDCVGKTLGSGEGNMNVIPEKQFVDEIYPCFETSTAPMDVHNLNKLVQNPSIAEKFNE